MSLINYRTLLTEGGYALKPLWNSTLLGVGSATIVMLLVAAISYFVHKTRLGGRKILDFLAFAPIALPSVVLGSAFLLALSIGAAARHRHVEHHRLGLFDEVFALCSAFLSRHPWYKFIPSSKSGSGGRRRLVEKLSPYLFTASSPRSHGRMVLGHGPRLPGADDFVDACALEQPHRIGHHL